MDYITINTTTYHGSITKDILENYCYKICKKKDIKIEMRVYILMNNIFVYDSLIDQNINKRPIIKIICEETIFKYVSQSNMFVYYNLRSI